MLLEFDAAAIHAGLDLSDGLAGDAAHLAKRSGVTVNIDANLLPISPQCREAAQVLQLDALEWALSGGEDYELLLAVAPEKSAPIMEKAREIGIALTEIGECVSPSGDSVVVHQNGKIRAPTRAWTHF